MLGLWIFVGIFVLAGFLITYFTSKSYIWGIGGAVAGGILAGILAGFWYASQNYYSCTKMGIFILCAIVILVIIIAAVIEFKPKLLKYCFNAIIIALILWGVSAAIYNSSQEALQHEIILSTQQIVALKDVSKVEGGGCFINWVIASDDYYKVMAKEGKGYMQKAYPTNLTKVFESDGPPRVETLATCRDGEKSHNLECKCTKDKACSYCIRDSYEEYYAIYVPKGTIQQGFIIDLQ